MKKSGWPTLASLATSLLLVAAPAHAADDFAQWRYYKVIKLDTTASGANVEGDVARFPVPVVLAANSFDFKQAASGGADVRFSLTPDGDPLPYSIETWDKGGAVLWVKLPVVKGNDKTQSFVMHWGN